jgi:hypothetical protein
VINYRRAVALDRCDGLAYEPLAAPAMTSTLSPVRTRRVQAVASPVPMQTDK